VHTTRTDADQFIMRFLQTVRDLTRTKRPPHWVTVQSVTEAMGIGHSEQVDEAIAYATNENLLSVDRLPAQSVAITASGIAILGRRKGNRRRLPFS
jgi:hypothetical protein